jgi:hypothetical protein
MSSSFEKINYNLRPNKCIERKMMCEALSRLAFIDHLEKYRYIGFGSPYFADFILFHKYLGITKLISIEKEEAKKARFEFNIPYSGIKMEYGSSHTILPNLELHNHKNIVWLDYDDKISDYMFADIETFFSSAMAGSFFILSLNVEQDLQLTDTENKLSITQYRINELIARIGKNRLPTEFMSTNLNNKNLIKVCFELINRQIITSLIIRNGVNKNKVKYKQLFNFSYKDNATILTIGGIIYDDAQKSKINKMQFDNLPFIQSGENTYKIESPNLTSREIKALDKVLPDVLEFEKGKFKNKKIRDIPLNPTDIQNYAKVYRYYPNFAETTL